MKIREGRYYRTRDGRKVGPMVFDDGANLFVWDGRVDGHNKYSWTRDGKFLSGSEHGLDLIAEWNDETCGQFNSGGGGSIDDIVAQRRRTHL